MSVCLRPPVPQHWAAYRETSVPRVSVGPPAPDDTSPRVCHSHWWFRCWLLALLISRSIVGWMNWLIDWLIHRSTNWFVNFINALQQTRTRAAAADWRIIECTAWCCLRPHRTESRAGDAGYGKLKLKCHTKWLWNEWIRRILRTKKQRQWWSASGAVFWFVCTSAEASHTVPSSPSLRYLRISLYLYP